MEKMDPDWLSKIPVGTSLKMSERSPNGHYEMDFTYQNGDNDNTWLYMSERIVDINEKGHYKKATLTLDCWKDSDGNIKTWINFHDPNP
jgi:hypothetical protein